MEYVPARVFSERCLDDLPGIPLPLLERRINDTARELLRAGRLWKVSQQLVVEADATTVELEPLPECAVIHDFAEVCLNDIPIFGSHAGQSEHTSNETRWQREGNSLVLDGHAQAGTLTVLLVLISRDGARDYPQILLDEWVETIEMGTKAKAMMQPGHEWSDANTGRMMYRLYKQKIAKARTYGRAGGATIRRRTIDPWARNSREQRSFTR